MDYWLSNRLTITNSILRIQSLSQHATECRPFRLKSEIDEWVHPDVPSARFRQVLSQSLQLTPTNNSHQFTLQKSNSRTCEGMRVVTAKMVNINVRLSNVMTWDRIYFMITGCWSASLARRAWHRFRLDSARTESQILCAAGRAVDPRRQWWIVPQSNTINQWSINTIWPQIYPISRPTIRLWGPNQANDTTTPPPAGG